MSKYTAAVHDHMQSNNIEQTVKGVYRRYITRWQNTKYANEQREYLFNHVHLIRNKTNANWGEHQHYFYDVDLNVIGPYETEEITYAAWLMYMESKED